MSTTVEPPRTTPPRRGLPFLLGLLAVCVLLAATVLVLVLRPVGTPALTSAAPTPSASQVPPTSPQASSRPSTGPSTPQSPRPRPTASAPPDAVTAVWPASSSAVRYRDPVAAARGFAVGLVGFRSPVLGPYQAGDARSGEVELRAEAGASASTVLVRRLSDDTWWVLGAVHPDLRLDTPSTGEAISSPVVLSGQARAFEGHVTVRIVADGATSPLASGFVTGGGDIPRPFSGTFPFTRTAAGHGAIVLTTESARDGQVWTTSVIRVAFAP